MSTTSEQYELIMQLLEATEGIEAFECDGFKYLGNRVSFIKEYVKQNPSDKFNIWMAKVHPECLIQEFITV